MDHEQHASEEPRKAHHYDPTTAWTIPGAGVPEQIREVVAYLRDRGLAADCADAANILTKLLELSGRADAAGIGVSRAARLLYMSRRSLARLCMRSGLPTPSRILAFGRIVRATRILHSTGWSVFRVAEATGWVDPFGLSKTMHRLTGIRPTDARERGLLYLAEAWLQREVADGGAVLRHPRAAPCPSCGQQIRLVGDP
ncbi:MAG: helix-turn-helix domain-containing protein [Longimicrobiales bacterium]